MRGRGAAPPLSDLSFPPLPHTVRQTPDPPDASKVSSTAAGISQTPSNIGRASFAALVAKSQTLDRFPPISLPPREYGSRDGCPMISFTAAELIAGAKRFEYTLIAKFTIGRPSLKDIRQFLEAHWRLKGRMTIIDIWDGRHIAIILDSEDDVRVALTYPNRKVGHAFFRLFRWSVDYNPKREATRSTDWIRLPGLPLRMYDKSYIRSLVSSFAYFLDVDARTRECCSLNYARACVELDVTQNLPSKLLIQTPEGEFFQEVVYEGNLSYCSKCCIHGHNIINCRKVQVATSSDKTKSTMTKRREEPTPPKVPHQLPEQGRGHNPDSTIVAQKDAENSSHEEGRKANSNKDSRPVEATIPSGQEIKGSKCNPKHNQEDWIEVGRKKSNRVVAFQSNNAAAKSTGPGPSILIEEFGKGNEGAPSHISNGNNEDEDSLEGEMLPDLHNDDDKSKEVVDAMALVVYTEDVAGGSAHEEMRVQDRGSVAEEVIATNASNALPSIDSSEDYMVHTREDGSFYCDVFGGKRFQDKGELAKFAEENGFVINDVPITTIEESGKDGEDREVIRNSDNEPCGQVDQVESQVPIISSQQRTRHRKKKGSRSSTRSCPKKKDDDFVWT